MNLIHIGLVNKSQRNADKFFHDILGLKKGEKKYLSSEMSNKIFGFKQASDFVYYYNDSVVFEVFINDKKGIVDDQINHVCIEVKKRDNLAIRCKKAGLEVKKIDKQGSVMMFIRDFDRNLYEVKEIQ